MNTRLRALLFVGLPSALLVGCSTRAASGGAPAISHEPVPTTGGLATSWVGSDSSSALLIQWTDVAGHLTGELSEVDESPSGLASVVPTEESLTGEVAGQSLTLTLDASQNLTGIIGTDALTLNVPQSDGTIAAFTLHPGTPAAYNALVAALTGAAASTDAQEQAAAASQSAAAAAASAAQQAINEQDSLNTTAQRQGQAVAADIAQLTADGAEVSQAVASIPSDLKGQASDVASTLRDEQAEIAEGSDGTGGQCSDAAGVYSDAAGVASDAAGVASDDAGVSSTLASLRGDEAQLSADLQQLVSDQQAAPDVTGLPTSGQVSAAEATAKHADAAAVSATNADIDKANAATAQAYLYGGNANAAGHCGNAETAPAAQPHIS